MVFLSRARRDDILSAVIVNTPFLAQNEDKPSTVAKAKAVRRVPSAIESALVRSLMWLLVSAAFTALVIQYSYAHGKLLCPPFYDDVAYFEDALHRLEKYYTDGVFGIIADYRAWPPHSPFSSAMAAGAYAILGIHDWAPYVANGLIILGLLFFLDHLSGGVSLIRKLSLIFFVLCVPISAESVYEFRPDMASALCCAIGATMLLWRSITRTTWKFRAMAGAMFGLALLFKPPTSPLTLMVFAATVIVAGAIELFLDRPQLPVLSRAWGQCLIPTLLIPLPHYLLTWRDTWLYIKEPIFGTAHSIWQTPGTRVFHLLWYLTGPGGQLLLGRELWLLLAVVLAGSLVIAFTRHREQMARMTGFLAVCAVAWTVPTKMDVYVMCLLLRARGVVPALAILVLTGSALSLATFTARPYNRGSPVVIVRNRLIGGIYQRMRDELPQTYSRVYITTTGYVNAGVLDYYFRRDTLHALNVGENSYSGDVAMHVKDMHVADLVIASEPKNGEAWGDFIKSGEIQDQTLAAIRDDPDFVQVASFPTYKDKHYYLFRRVRPFCGWDKPQGLTDASTAQRGAYWGVGPSTKLSISAGGYDKLRLVLRARSGSSPISALIMIDGRRRARWQFSDRDEDYTRAFAVVGGGPHEIEFVYDPAPTDNSPLVLFSRLEIIPDALK
jgi:hypothetical protein